MHQKLYAIFCRYPVETSLFRAPLFEVTTVEKLNKESDKNSTFHYVKNKL